jgi:hypothetical protein
MENVYPPEAPEDAPYVGANSFAAFAKTKPDCLADTEAKNGILVT